MVSSGITVFYGKASSHIVGLLIGISGMLAQLFFVLCVIFFVYADHAISTGHGIIPYIYLFLSYFSLD